MDWTKVVNIFLVQLIVQYPVGTGTHYEDGNIRSSPPLKPAPHPPEPVVLHAPPHPPRRDVICCDIRALIPDRL